ncbi:MAG TPA: glycosyltransferase [Verrucomicrobiae bacterium]|nr:glycosyltransferase [Verrucomicrobiae bacterium]
MLLSILVPSFNHGRYIAATLDSCLAQSYRPIEIMVADGASRDATVPILEDYASRYPEVRWISEPDAGPADAVNKALKLARGEVAAIQSSDDLYTPGAFEPVMRVFRERRDCGLVIGDYQGIDEAGTVLYTEKMPDFSWEAYFARSFAIPQSSIFFRTTLGREVGGWNARYYSPDMEFWMRLMLRTQVQHLPRVLSQWRIYAGQRTHSPQARRRIWDDYQVMVSETPELRAAPRRIRRLAAASADLLALRFHPTGELASVRRHLLRGFLRHPTFWRHYPWPIRPWLPWPRTAS